MEAGQSMTSRYELLPSEEPVIPQTKTRSQNLTERAKEAVRPFARTATNLTGLATGLPGDIASLINRFVAAPLTEFAGNKPLPYEETYLGKVLPTSQQTTEGLRSLAPEYLKPQNKVEEFVDDVINDTALLFSPAKTKVPYAKTASTAAKYLKPFAVSLGANLVGKGVEDISGHDPQKTAWAKTGSLFLLSLLSKPAAAKYASQLYKEAESALPKGATVDASRLQNNLENLKQKISAGRPISSLAPSEKFVVDEVDNVLGLVKNGRMDVNTAWASKRSLNEKLEKVLFDTPEKRAQARARKTASQIQHELSQTLDTYGHLNPQFGKPFRSAEEAFGTIAQSNVVSKFVENNLKYSPVTSGLIHLFHGPIGGAAAQAAAPYQVAKLTYRIAKSPTLAKYYGKVLQAAASEDAAIFNRELERLDKALQKEEGKDRYELID
jgi:hypothetical protein